MAKRFIKYIPATLSAAVCVSITAFPLVVPAAYPLMESAPFVECRGVNSSAAIEEAVSHGANSVSIDIKAVFNSESGTYVPVLFSGEYLDINGDGINELIYDNDQAPEQAENEGIGIINYEDLAAYYAATGMELMTADAFLAYLSSAYPWVNADFRLSGANPAEAQGIVNTISQYAYSDRSMITVTGTSLEELTARMQEVQNAGYSRINLDLSGVAAQILGGESAASPEAAEALVQYLSADAFGIVAQSMCVTLPGTTITSCMDLYNGFLNVLYSFGVAVCADVSSDTSVSGTLASAGVDILESYSPAEIIGSIGMAIEEVPAEPVPVEPDPAPVEEAPTPEAPVQEPEPAPVYYDVVFYSDYGTPPESYQILEGYVPEYPGVLEAGGMVFTGYFSDEACTVPYGFSEPVYAPVAIYCGWREETPLPPVSIEIIFNGNGAEENTFGTQVYTVGAEGQAFTGTISRSGYKMLGWVENPEQPDPVYDTFSSVSDDWIVSKADQGIASQTLYAYWQEIPVYPVTFDLNGGPGEAPAAQDITEGGTAAVPEDPEPSEGMKFTGWFLEPEAVNIYDFAVPVTSGLTLYAGWAADENNKTYSSITVIFNGNGAEANTFETQTFIEGMEGQMFTGTITRNGYQAIGWASDPTSTSPDYAVNDTVSDDWIISKATETGGTMTLYAVWEPVTPDNVNIMFDMQGHGEQIPNQVIPKGGYAVIPEDPFEIGLIFLGWYTDPGLTQPFDPAAPVTNNLILYALWTPEPVYHFISFDMQGIGNAPATQTVDDGAAAQRPSEDPSMNGFIFHGWFSDPDCTIEYDFAAPVYADTIIYAGWEQAAAPPPVPVYNPSPAAQPAAQPATQAPEMDWLFTYDMQGHGEQIPAVRVKDNETAVKPEDPVSEGYLFEGWYKTRSFEELYDFAQPVTYQTTVYAKWSEIVTEPVQITYYTVSFVPGNGTSIEPQAVAAGNLAVKPADPLAKKHQFEGWYQDNTLTEPFDFTTPVNSDLTLYARWSMIYPDVTYTVSFSSENIIINKQYIHSGTRAEKPADPARKGFVFTGWYTDSRCKNKYDFNAVVNGNMTLYAGWELKTEEPVNQSSGTTPKTGDDSGMILWILTGFLSLIALAVSVYILKRRKHH